MAALIDIGGKKRSPEEAKIRSVCSLLDPTLLSPFIHSVPKIQMYTVRGLHNPTGDGALVTVWVRPRKAHGSRGQMPACLATHGVPDQRSLGDRGLWALEAGDCPVQSRIPGMCNKPKPS